MHVETRSFLIFQNNLATKNFQNHMNFFSSSAKHYFLQNVRYIHWNLKFDLVIISQKNDGFYFLINLKSKKVLTSLLTSFAMSKNKTSSALRLIIGTLLPNPLSQCYLSLSVWCVLCSFTPFLLLSLVSHGKNLVFYS